MSRIGRIAAIALFVAAPSGLISGADEAAGVKAPVSRLPLTEPALAATPDQRQLLEYLVTCALPVDVELYADLGDTHYAFRGSMGLAPAWAVRPLTETEQRWVSACILARTNAFGKPVPISTRAWRSGYAALETSEQEKETYTLFEGGFFGNIFAERPVAYVCSAQHTPEEQADPILAERVCTAPSGEKTADGAPLTRCSFVHVGACGGTGRFTVDGETFDEVIFTYLKPSSID